MPSTQSRSSSAASPSSSSERARVSTPDSTHTKPRRTRASDSKVKTGCLTCKRRHKKCDEARPSCRTCISKGYKCDGYAAIGPKKPRDALQASLLGAQHYAPISDTLVEPSSMPAFARDEQRYFDIFCKYTIPQLAGGFESSFWQTFIPRASCQIPCIRHATVALAALHESFAHDDTLVTRVQPTDTISDFTTTQYGMAMQSLLTLVRESGDGATEVVLSMCILFICFELLRGNHNAVLLHTQSGMNVLTDTISHASTHQGSQVKLIPLSAIAPVFTRIDVQALDILSAAPPGKFAKLTQPIVPLAVPKTFSSQEHSKQCLLEHQNFFMYKVREVVGAHGRDSLKWPKEDLDRLLLLRSEYLGVEDRWFSAHQTLAHEQARRNDAQVHRASSILLVHYFFLRVALLRFPSEDEMDFDNYTGLFKQMIDASRSVFDHSLNAVNEEHLTLSFDLGIAEPLFYIISRCRHPCLRREALDLLEQCPSNEGIWNSSLAAAMGKRIMEIEERGSPVWPKVLTEQDVPRAARILEAMPQYMKNTGDLHLSYRIMSGKLRQEKIDWPGPASQKFLASRALAKYPMGRYQRGVKTRLRLSLNQVPRPKEREEIPLENSIQTATPPVEPIVTLTAHPNHAFQVAPLVDMFTLGPASTGDFGDIYGTPQSRNSPEICSSQNSSSSTGLAGPLTRAENSYHSYIYGTSLDANPVIGWA